MKTHVAFPNLGLDMTLNRRLVEFDAFGGGIYYYALIICAGFILAWLYISHEDKKLKGKNDRILDMVLIGLPVSIIFARAYYVIFSFDSYKDNLLDIFKVWNGGIAIYGGIIGAFLTVFLYCRKNELSVIYYLDLLAPALMIGQALGRWGNFVNGEAFGSLTSENYLLGMMVNGEGPYHPTFFYESMGNALGFLILHSITRKSRFSGFRLYFYMIWYGALRFFVEALRTDSLYIPDTDIRVSSLLSALIFITGLCLMITGYMKNRQKNTSFE